MKGGRAQVGVALWESVFCEFLMVVFGDNNYRGVVIGN